MPEQYGYPLRHTQPCWDSSDTETQVSTTFAEMCEKYIYLSLFTF